MHHFALSSSSGTDALFIFSFPLPCMSKHTRDDMPSEQAVLHLSAASRLAPQCEDHLDTKDFIAFVLQLVTGGQRRPSLTIAGRRDETHETAVLAMPDPPVQAQNGNRHAMASIVLRVKVLRRQPDPHLTRNIDVHASFVATTPRPALSESIRPLWSLTVTFLDNLAADDSEESDTYGRLDTYPKYSAGFTYIDKIFNHLMHGHLTIYDSCIRISHIARSMPAAVKFSFSPATIPGASRAVSLTQPSHGAPCGSLMAMETFLRLQSASFNREPQDPGAIATDCGLYTGEETIVWKKMTARFEMASALPSGEAMLLGGLRWLVDHQSSACSEDTNQGTVWTAHPRTCRRIGVDTRPGNMSARGHSGRNGGWCCSTPGRTRSLQHHTPAMESPQVNLADALGLTIDHGKFPGTISGIPGRLRHATRESKSERAGAVREMIQQQNPRRLILYTDGSQMPFSRMEWNIETNTMTEKWYAKVGIAVGWQEQNRTTGRMDWMEKTQDMTDVLLRGTWKTDRMEFEAVRCAIANVATSIHKGISPKADERGYRIGAHSNPWVETAGPNMTKITLITDSDNALKFIENPTKPLRKHRAFCGAEFPLRRLNVAAEELVSQNVSVELIWSPKNTTFGSIWADCWAKIARGADPWNELRQELLHESERKAHWRLWWKEMFAQGRQGEFY
ncbi:uncharacterized protein BKCO1_640007 [Diplodia corticola]|uniref:Uncharacterized protein n=1 Tax=Diplodia corticola TaxID=236234 RepID=A0A1J9QQD9_9PEZI|nr:uncharacterized protein BKCO1_640007 [Diplodia corticola]OJD30242.1 hypothetical protein BKCO1_640007 [Diplodia corticola]